MGNVLMLKAGKEYIVLRKASKNHTCHECGFTIPKGVFYIEDHINYLTRKRDGSVFKKWYVNKICLLSWKGAIPR